MTTQTSFSLGNAESPFFSICIPAHNLSSLLEAALDSVISQTFTNWEVIIVDDCSESEIEGQLKKGAKSLTAKIRCVRLEENKGPYYARKVAFDLARGSYILCLDSDDAFMRNSAFEEIYSAIKARVHLPDVVIFNATTNVEQQVSWANYRRFGLYNRDVDKETVVNCFLESSQLNNLCLKAIRAELLAPQELADVPRLYMCEDRLEVASVLRIAESFVLLDTPLYFYRQNPESTTHRLFELDYCRQQSFVEKSIAERFSEDHSLDGLYRHFLIQWVDDIRRITPGRSVHEATACLRVMAQDTFFKESLCAVGLKGQRLDRRLLLSLLARGHYLCCARAASLVGVLATVVKNFIH